MNLDSDDRENLLRMISDRMQEYVPHVRWGSKEFFMLMDIESIVDIKFNLGPINEVFLPTDQINRSRRSSTPELLILYLRHYVYISPPEFHVKRIQLSYRTLDGSTYIFSKLIFQQDWTQDPTFEMTFFPSQNNEAFVNSFLQQFNVQIVPLVSTDPFTLSTYMRLELVRQIQAIRDAEERERRKWQSPYYRYR